ncbi:hypothetical protein BH20ACT17_BH20ACT17_14540 [soil metagenome]
MRRTLLVPAVFALSGLLPAAVMAAAPSDAPPALRAALGSCKHSGLAQQRVTEFVGSMPARAGASRMRMRFDLERKRPTRRWRRVRGAAGFGKWERSLPSRAGFIFHKRVVGLRVPARYRALISFAWERSDGTILQRAQRRSAACWQPDLRPDLRFDGALSGVPAVQPGLALYTLMVRNAGRSASGPFSVRIGNGRIEAASLAAGERRGLLVLAPVCAGGSLLTARVDEEDRVDESHEDAHGARLPCPLG